MNTKDIKPILGILVGSISAMTGVLMAGPLGLALIFVGGFIGALLILNGANEQ